MGSGGRTGRDSSVREAVDPVAAAGRGEVDGAGEAATAAGPSEEDAAEASGSPVAGCGRVAVGAGVSSGAAEVWSTERFRRRNMHAVCGRSAGSWGGPGQGSRRVNRA